MEEDFKEAKEEIKQIYKEIREAVDLNEELYIMPVGLYNSIINKMILLEAQLKRQTKSLKNHLEEKQELRRQLKKWEKQ